MRHGAIGYGKGLRTGQKAVPTNEVSCIVPAITPGTKREIHTDEATACLATTMQGAFWPVQAPRGLEA